MDQENPGLRSEDPRERGLSGTVLGFNVPSKIASEAQHSNGSWEINGS